MFRKNAVFILLTTLLLPNFLFGQTNTMSGDAAIAKIKEEGMSRSQAMKTMRYLTDVIGARLTNSPAQKRANQWTKEQFEKWGLQNATVDPWGEFGRGWELKRYVSSFATPTETSVFRSYPKAWSPSTNGAVTADVVVVDAKNEEELAAYKGKLKGAIVLIADDAEVTVDFQPDAKRRSTKELEKLETAEPTPPQQFTPTEEQRKAQQFAQRKYRFYFEEGAAVLVDAGLGVDGGTIRVMGASPAPQTNTDGNPFGGIRVYAKNAAPTLPQIVAEAEQYNRILRLVRQGVPVKMTIDLEAKFYDDDLQGYNTLAEIPGTDLKDEVVMIGAHLDSWHSGTGATDNGAGTTVVMEAMRILQASGLKPRRTIRVALWTGEEQGLLGSRGYVKKNLATIGDGSDAAAFSAFSGGKPSINKTAAYDKFAAYYNLDNGTGQIRGVYMQDNEAVRPIFRDWLAPFAEYDAKTLTINSTGGTDHLAFDAVGLPGFQFIQDPIEYFTRTWHTTQDVSDRILEEDLKRSAIIMAAFAYNSAMTDEKLPRKTPASNAATAFFKGFDFRAEREETAFRFSGLDHSICGHDVESHEIPSGFPAFLSVNLNNHAYAE